MDLAMRLLLFAFALVVSQAAHAEESACKFTEWGYGYMKVVGPNGPWTYSMKASGPTWRTEPFGYHAPGLLLCESCSSDGARGLYYFLDQSILDSSAASPHRRPTTATERAARSKESFGYPSIDVGPDQLQPKGLKEGVNLGPLTGYAVVYRLNERKAGGNPAAEKGLLAISLTDGCVTFETSIVSGPGTNGSEWSVLDTLLNEVSVTKTPSADIAPSAGSTIVRPLRDGEKPIFLHELFPPRGK
jgi:hypothetical protein